MMTAVEVLRWILENDEKDIIGQIFDTDYCDFHNDFFRVAATLSPEEIVLKIEKYEAEKNHIAEADKKVEQEFKVGDWVKYSIHYYGKEYTGITQIVEIGQSEFIGNVVYGVRVDGVGKILFSNANSFEHVEPPKEELEVSDFKNVIKEKIGEECANIVLSSPKEFGDWIDRMKWHVEKCNELRRLIDILDNTDPQKEEKQKFKVGDLINKKDGTTITHRIVNFSTGKKYPVIEDLCGNFLEINPEEWEHAEPPKEENRECFHCGFYSYADFPRVCKECKEHSNYKSIPKEEKHKIEKIKRDFSPNKRIAEMQDKINKLVDAVNELRGVE